VREHRAIGVDVGGTKIAAAVVDGRGRIVGTTLRRATPRAGGPAIVEVMIELVRELRRSEEVTAIGVGSAGTFDLDGRVAYATELLPAWTGTPVRELLARSAGLPVTVVNDVHAAAVGEAAIGAAADVRRAFVAAVGTGIGGALVIDGRLDPGPHGTAGSIGHVPIAAAEGMKCSCGALGHLEAIASGPAMEREYARRTSGGLSLQEVGSRAAAGDEQALDVIETGGRALGTALAAAANLVDPEVIVLGGGVAELGGLFIGPARTAFARSALPSVNTVPIVAAKLGVEAPVVGGALAALRAAGVL
jgi:glucokinase